MCRYRLELPNGKPAGPPELSAATPMWRPGDPVFVSPKRRYRVIEVRPDAEGGDPVLVVKPEFAD